MAEQMKSITDARQGLPGLSHNAGERMERYVITQQGQPQSVLLGYRDYQGMVAAVDLLHQPATLANLHRGIQRLREGEGMTFEEMEEAVERAEAKELERHGRRERVTSSLTNPGGRLHDSNVILEETPFVSGKATTKETGVMRSALESPGTIPPAAISTTIEIPEFGNIELILTRTVGGGIEGSQNEPWVATAIQPSRQSQSAQKTSMAVKAPRKNTLKARA
jgi:PHD/YefM family antitoxin component YafN of YafNO toxin-antitoxin module